MPRLVDVVRRSSGPQKHKKDAEIRRAEALIREAVDPHHPQVIESFRSKGFIHPKFWTDMTKHDLASMFKIPRLVISPLWDAIVKEQQLRKDRELN